MLALRDLEAGHVVLRDCRRAAVSGGWSSIAAGVVLLGVGESGRVKPRRRLRCGRRSALLARLTRTWRIRPECRRSNPEHQRTDNEDSSSDPLSVGLNEVLRAPSGIGFPAGQVCFDTARGDNPYPHFTSAAAPAPREGLALAESRRAASTAARASSGSTFRTSGTRGGGLGDQPRCTARPDAWRDSRRSRAHASRACSRGHEPMGRGRRDSAQGRWRRRSPPRAARGRSGHRGADRRARRGRAASFARECLALGKRAPDRNRPEE
jgi:hypothetical protein